jgi:hypothetical protein
VTLLHSPTTTQDVFLSDEPEERITGDGVTGGKTSNPTSESTNNARSECNNYLHHENVIGRIVNEIKVSATNLP